MGQEAHVALPVDSLQFPAHLVTAPRIVGMVVSGAVSGHEQPAGSHGSKVVDQHAGDVGPIEHDDEGWHHGFHRSYSPTKSRYSPQATMSQRAGTTSDPSDYWDDVTVPFVTGDRHVSWRQFCDRVHGALLRDWAPKSAVARALKTDMFDEAAGGGLAHALADVAGEVHGLDVSAQVVRAARDRHEGLTGVIADVRTLPYRSAAFGLVLSNSTLDHFPRRRDIAESLVEIARVTEPGGTLIVTLDNLMNPVIALRAILPRRLLRATGVVPYHVGPTLTLRALCREVTRAGFSVRHTKTLIHVPRVLAIPLADRRDRRGAPPHEGTIRRLMSWERLAKWPTRQLTGHFVAVQAERTVLA